MSVRAHVRKGGRNYECISGSFIELACKLFEISYQGQKAALAERAEVNSLEAVAGMRRIHKQH